MDRWKRPACNRLGVGFVVAMLVVLHSSMVSRADEMPKGAQLDLLTRFANEFVSITPGQGKFPNSFKMGSTNEKNEQPVREVTIGYHFAIAKYEVPQNLYEAVMGNNPSRWKGPRNSVEMFDYDQAVSFCHKITVAMQARKLLRADEEIRLPTEAEWEYCCRAGSTTKYGFGNAARTKDDIDNEAAARKNKDIAKDDLRKAVAKASHLDPYAWHTGNAAGNDPPVGALKPNAWGLYDMHGYLWEFVADDWASTYKDAPTNGEAVDHKAKDNNAKRVVRGGSWRELYPRLTSTVRWAVDRDFKRDDIGLRCVRAKVKKTSR